MARSVSLNGSSFSIPGTGDSGWSQSGGVDDYLVALATGVLTKAGGTFTLSAEVNLGATYGLKSAYLKTQTLNPAAAGVLRLAKTDTIGWRNNANGADLALTIDGSDNLTFNGTKVGLSGNIVNADINAAAAIAYSKLALTGAIQNADLAGSIAYSKLTLTGSIVNADVSATAAIAYSKLNLAGAVKLASDVTGLLPAANGGTGVLSTATFPTSGVVVTEAGTETLTNKTLTAPVISSIVNTGTLTLPTSTDTLVGRATTDTLTNKTLTTPVIASIVNTGTLTLPTSTDTLVGRATTDTLTNKTLTSPTLATPLLSSYADLTQVTTPASPASGKDRLYFKSDDNLYSLTSAGIEKQIGSGAGGSGQKNYVSSAASNTAATWTTYGTVAATTDTTAADLPRATTTASGWKLTPSGSASGTFTVTLATPGVFTAAAHGMQTGYTVTFSTTGALPTGLTAGTVYYVNVVSSSTFNVATTMANLLAGTYVATSGSQSGTQSFTFGGAYLRFTLDAADYGVKQQLQNAQNILSGATGDWEVDVYSNTASNYAGTYTRLPLSTDSSGSTTLPNLEGTFKTTFDAPGSAQQYIEVRWNKLAANTHALVGSDLVVGPGVSVQGAAVTDAVAWTPTGSWSTNTTYTGQYWRVGPRGKFYVKISLSGAPNAIGLTVNMPSGLTVNSSQIDTGNSAGNVGVGQGSPAGTESIFQVVTGGSTSTFNVVYQANTSGGESSVNATQPGTWASGNVLELWWDVPVNEWAGSGTVNVASNDLQYYYGTGGSWGTSATVTTAQGPGGALGGTTAPAGASFAYTIVPTYPVPVGTVPYVETSPDQVHWTRGTNLDAPGPIEALKNDGTNYVGVGASVTTAGNIKVTFGKYASGITTAPNNWGGTWYWRVTVGLPGQAVGFGIVQPGVASGLVSASGVPGNTLTPATAPTGYVGEEALSHVSTLQNINAVSGTGFNALTIPVGASPAANTISPGDWEITGTIYLSSGAATFTTNYDVYWALSGTSGNAFTGEATGINAWEFTIPAAASPSRNSFITPVLRATYDGTTLIVNGQSFTSPAAGLVLKMQVNNWSGTTPQYTGTLRARRVR